MKPEGEPQPRPHQLEVMRTMARKKFDSNRNEIISSETHESVIERDRVHRK